MVTVNTDSSQFEKRSWHVARLFLKAVGLTFLIWLVLTVGTLVIGGAVVYYQAQSLATQAGTSLPELKFVLERGWKTSVTATDDRKNVLILGVDSLAGRGTVPPLTDTIMVASLNLKTGQVTLLPLPRDLWSEAYQTKINALYAYGQERNPTQPWLFPQTVLSEMTGLQFHHVLVLSLDQVAEIIDVLGGVDVPVEVGFVDELFPRPNVNVTVERDPAKLYQRVEFVAGVEHMTGERVLQYIRSRHAAGPQGTDDARSRRQELVMSALFAQAQRRDTFTNLPRLANLYRYYTTHFSSQFPLEQGIATAKMLWPVRTQIKVQSQNLSVFPADPSGSLINPPITPQKFQGQWVYAIRNPETFKAEIKTKL